MELIPATDWGSPVAGIQLESLGSEKGRVLILIAGSPEQLGSHNKACSEALLSGLIHPSNRSFTAPLASSPDGHPIGRIMERIQLEPWVAGVQDHAPRESAFIEVLVVDVRLVFPNRYAYLGDLLEVDKALKANYLRGHPGIFFLVRSPSLHPINEAWTIISCHVPFASDRLVNRPAAINRKIGLLDGALHEPIGA